MRDTVKKKLLYVASYFILALFMEFLTFNVMGMGVFPQYYWLDVIVLLGISAFIFIIPSFKAESILICVLLFLQALLSFVNDAMYSHRTMLSVFTIDMLNLVKTVGDVFNREFVSYPFMFGLLSILAIEIFFLVYLRRYKTERKTNKKVFAIFLVVFITIEIFTGTAFTSVTDNLTTAQTNEDLYLLRDDKELFDSFNYTTKVSAFKKFGTFAFYLRNISKVLTFSDADEFNQSLNEIDNYLSLGEMSCDSGNYTDYTGVLNGNNLIMIMIESGEWYGIDERLTPTLYALSTQGISASNYLSKNKTNQSEEITILGSYPTESSITSALKSDSDNGTVSYPFSLASVLSNHGYSTSYMHDNEGEFYERNATHHALGFQNLYFVEQMPLLSGYNGKANFYNLDSDYLMLSTMKEQIAPKNVDNFYTFITSITMHGNYDNLVEFANKKDNPLWDYTVETSEKEKKEYKGSTRIPYLCDYYERITKDDFIKKFVDTGLVDQNEYSPEEFHTLYLRYKQYQAAYMDLDFGVSVLLDYLKETGKLETTTVMMYGDHNTYYHDMAFRLKGYSPEDSENYYQNLYRVPFIMYDGSMPLTVTYDNQTTVYSNGLNSKFKSGKGGLKSNGNGGLEIARWTSPYDVVPTVLDLFGFSFNKNLYQGSSMFASIDEYDRSMFVSMESGVMNDKIISLNLQDIYYHDDGTIYKINVDDDLVYIYGLDGELLAKLELEPNGKPNEVAYYSNGEILCEFSTEISLDGIIKHKVKTADKVYVFDFNEMGDVFKDAELLNAITMYKVYYEFGTLFDNQYVNFRDKQYILELCYSTRFFNYKGYKSKDGSEHEYVTIDDLVKKVK